MDFDNRAIEFYSVIRHKLDDTSYNQEVTCQMGRLIYIVSSIEQDGVAITTFNVLDLIPDQATRKFNHLSRLLFRLTNDDRIDRISFHSQLVQGFASQIDEWREGGIGFIKEGNHYIWDKPDIMKWKNRHDNLEEAATAVMKMKRGIHRVYSKDGVLECSMNKGTFTIDFIEIWEEYRGQGRWSALLRHIAAQRKVKKIVVFMVCNDHMDRIMTKIKIDGSPFINKGCEYSWNKNNNRKLYI